MVWDIDNLAAEPWVIVELCLFDGLDELIVGGEADGCWFVAALLEGYDGVVELSGDVNGAEPSLYLTIDRINNNCYLHLIDINVTTVSVY